jgi:hypothetical protein
MNSTRAPSWPFDQTVVGFGIPHVVFPLDFDNHARLVIFVMVVVLILVVHVSPCPYVSVMIKFFVLVFHGRTVAIWMLLRFLKEQGSGYRKSERSGKFPS